MTTEKMIEVSVENSENENYRAFNIFISPDKHKEQFLYLDNISRKSNNLYNAALFRERQCLTSSKKSEEDITSLEKEVIAECKLAREKIAQKNEAIIKYNENLKDGEKPKKVIKTVVKPTKSGYLSFPKLDLLLRFTKNPDYCEPSLPKQIAQNIVKQVCNDISGFFESIKEYYANPEKFTGKPSLTDYKHKGGIMSFTMTNQNCKIRQNKEKQWILTLPLTKTVIVLGAEKPKGKLKEVHVTPYCDKYQVSIVLEDEEFPEPLKTGRHIGIDIGVNNLMAVVSNCSFPCMLFNGRPVKSINQRFNKLHADYVSKATKGGKKYVATPEDNELSLWRRNSIRDYFFKSVKQLMNLCVENRIDTIVIGHNIYWKQETNMGRQSNQNFV